MNRNVYTGCGTGEFEYVATWLKSDCERQSVVSKTIDIQNGGVAVFRMLLYPCILHTLRILYGRETLVELVMCLKRLLTLAFGSSEPFHGRVRVGAIPT